MSENVDLNKFTCKCGASEWVLLYVGEFKDGKHYLACNSCHSHDTYPVEIKIRENALPLDLIHSDWN